MAKTSYIDILPEIEDQFFSNIQPGDRFTFARVRRKNVLLSHKTKKGISQRSLLPEISVAWATLSDAQKLAWSNAGAECNLNGWRLFVQDYCARRVNDLPDLATPSLLHQSWVGQVHIEAPATEVKLVQIHPRNYYISKKVAGKKSMYSPVLVTEDLTLPFDLTLNYSSNLVAEGANPYAKIYAEFWYSYQGVNLIKNLEIPLDLVTDWKTVTAQLASLVSYVVRYDLHIHLHDLRGDLYFDNVKAEHGSQNWARDPFCKDINQGFTRNYYQIPKHWSAEIAPEGVIFETVYKDF
jgi:hypothetical protein